MKHFLIVILTVLANHLAFAQQAASSKLPYQDENLLPEQRAEDLLHRLTLEEKINLMQNSSKPVERLGIKAYDWWSEALHGVARAGQATVFPQTIGMAASFNNELLLEVFNAVSDEMRVKYRQFSSQGAVKRYQGLTVWTPNINIFRDPRWGRGQETYGEDPYLTSIMGQAVVRGLQGDPDARYNKLHACAKHYAVHSGPEWNRHTFNTSNIKPRDLYETYLPAFKDLVQKANVKEVMCAYQRFEGEPCCGSDVLLQEILREDWGFQGVVVSDCSAIRDFYTPEPKGHGISADAAQASAIAVLAGTDVECGSSYKSLTEAVEQVLIDEEQIDVSVGRLLKARFELGEMDDPSLVPWMQLKDEVINCDKHKQLALQMARESMILLLNKNNILPLSKDLKIAVMGPNATDSVTMWGNYNGFPFHTVTVLEGIQRKVKPENLIYEYGCGHVNNVSLISMFDQCAVNGKKGFEVTYFGQRNMQGEPVATAMCSEPIRLSSSGATVFAPNVPLSDFSGIYHSVFTPRETTDVSFEICLTGNYTLYIDGEKVSSSKHQRIPTIIHRQKVEAGKSYDIRLEYSVAEDGSLQFDLGKETQINLNAAVSAVKDADVVVFAGGISPRLEGEEMPVAVQGFKGGDRTDIELPDVQRRLLAELHKAGKKIIFVNYSGSAVGMVPEIENCDAILQAWYPGEAGGEAVSEVLFGDYNPAGRLPVTFYKNVDQLPDYEDYNMAGHTYRFFKEEPLFPFGYGLSYTTFGYGNPELSKNAIKAGEPVVLSIPVSNKGKVAGDEVVQVYLRKTNDPEGPGKTLRAFKRVNIPAGKTVNVTFELLPDQLQWWDDSNATVHPHAGNYELLVGGSSKNEDLKKVDLTLQ